MQKNIIIIVIVLLLPSFTYAQIQSGEIIYKAEYLDKKKNNKLDTLEPKSTGEQMAKENLADIFKRIEQGIPHIKFQLTFTQSEALFKNISGMDSDYDNNNLSPIQLALAAVGGKGIYYTNHPKNLNVLQKEHLKLVRIHSKVSDIEWEIKNEFKTIAGYRCQKAQTNIYANSTHLEKEVTVWFTKDLPFSFGPMGMVGLPGMILGFERFKHFIYAQNIKFSKNDKKITPPKKGEKVTMEYIKEVDEDMRKNPLKYINYEE